MFDSSMINEPSRFEPLKFYCTYIVTRQFILLRTYELSRDTTFSTKLHVRPANTRISHRVGEFSLSAGRRFGPWLPRVYLSILGTRMKSCSVRFNFNPQSANHNNCRLLCLLPVTLKVIAANSVDQDQTAPLGAV